MSRTGLFTSRCRSHGAGPARGSSRNPAQSTRILPGILHNALTCLALGVSQYPRRSKAVSPAVSLDAGIGVSRLPPPIVREH
jgi:hypothetical protein